jgi:GH24 family phage-related lysozyme (muramidase)
MTAAEYIAGWEGFASTAYWDVNHWRLGYGSDTEGPDQINVTQGMTTTKPRALQNLAVRIPQFEKTAIRKVGADAWEKLSDNERAALLSIVYNYGNLPDSVARAILTGDSNNVAGAIRTLQNANGGVNKKRRLGEANFYLTGTSVAPQTSLHPVSKGAVVIGTGSLGGAAGLAANGANWQAIIMFAFSMVSYLVAALMPSKVTSPIPMPMPPAPAVVPLGKREIYQDKKAKLKTALQEFADAQKDFRDQLESDKADLDDDPSVTHTIDHVPTAPAIT